MTSPEERKIFRLVSTLRDKGTLSPKEEAELHELISQKKEYRHIYYDLIDTDLELENEWHADSVQKPSVASKLIRFPIFKIAASLAIGSTLTFLYYEATHHFLPSVDTASSVKQQWVGSIQKNTGTLNYNGSPIEPNQKHLLVGNYQLTNGTVNLDFFEGAAVQIEAPGKFEILSSDHISVSAGTLAAKVFDPRSRFKISNKSSAYIDLGTDFALKFQDDGSSDLHVFDGQVLASSLSKSGNSERVRLVSTDQTLRMQKNADFEKIKPSPGNSKPFSRFGSPLPAPLQIEDPYKASVIESAPVGYWRFNDQFHNELGSQSPLSIEPLGKEIGILGDTAQNPYLHFPQSKSFNALKISEPLLFEKNQNFSVELWACPDKYNRSTLFGLYDPSGVLETGETNHIALIDFMHRSLSFVHTPAAIRTAFRPVASDDYYLGINMFTDFHYVPGQWLHIVLVKNTDYIATYINGEETSKVQLSPEDQLEKGTYAAIFGQMSLQNWDTTNKSQKRPFSGGLDEVAIYYHPLTSKEVKKHFNASHK